MPLDALNVYLSLLVKVQKGKLFLLPRGCERESVKTDDMLATIDYVFHRIKSHERMAIKQAHQRTKCFHQDVYPERKVACVRAHGVCYV